MNRDEAREIALRLASHADAVKAAVLASDPEGGNLFRLNQLAWLGEMVCGHGDTLRLALGEPNKASPD